jgi:hypothetical protein
VLLALFLIRFSGAVLSEVDAATLARRILSCTFFYEKRWHWFYMKRTLGSAVLAGVFRGFPQSVWTNELS